MKTFLFRASLIVVVLMGTACEDDTSELRVMTRNVFVGGDVDRIIAAPSVEDVPILVLLTWQEIVANDFNARAEALADEIAREDPHLVGLQEISKIRTQTPGDFVEGGTVLAETVAYDFLDILLRALEDRGLDYEVAGSVQDVDAEMPMVVSADPLAFTDVRLTDYDVVLARSDVRIRNVVTRNFAQALEADLGGGVVLRIPRGFVLVDAEVDGMPVRFVNTHLEPASVPDLVPLQQAQSTELIETLDDRTVIVVGDLNSGPGDPSYDLFAAAGFRDAWNDTQGGSAGLTCCFGASLRPGRDLDRRYDLVLYRNGEGSTLTADASSRMGLDPVDVAGGIYPSDHAGVSAGFEIR